MVRTEQLSVLLLHGEYFPYCRASRRVDGPGGYPDSTAVVAFAGLHDEALLFGGQTNPVVGAGGIAAIRRVSQTVLVPQILIDLVVHLGQGLLLRNLEETAAGLARDLLQHFLAVGHIHREVDSAWAASAAIRPRVFEEDGIDQRVRPLRGFDGGGERDLAAGVDPVGEQDQRLAAALFAHELVGRQQDRIVQHGSSATAPATAAAAHGSAAPAAPAASTTAWIGVGVRGLLRLGRLLLTLRGRFQ